MGDDALDYKEAQRLAEKIFNTKLKKEDEDRRFRQTAYVTVSCGLQGACALVTLVLLLWATIQGMRFFAVLGITSEEPPGLAYASDDA